MYSSFLDSENASLSEGLPPLNHSLWGELIKSLRSNPCVATSKSAIASTPSVASLNATLKRSVALAKSLTYIKIINNNYY